MESKLVNMVKGFKSIKYHENNLMIWGVPGFAIPQFIFIYLQKLLEKNHGNDGKAIIFETGKQIGFASTEMMKQRFGYKDPARLFKMTAEQTEVVGYGKVGLVRADIENKQFTLTMESNIAKEYLKTFGIQKNPVCHMIRGCMCGSVRSLLGEELTCIETRCMAQGKNICEIVAKPLDQWDLNNEEIKNQIMSKIDTDVGLGEKMGKPLPKRF